MYLPTNQVDVMDSDSRMYFFTVLYNIFILSTNKELGRFYGRGRYSKINEKQQNKTGLTCTEIG